MKIRFRRVWKQFKAGQETELIPDGIATTLIRIGAAALVEDVKHDDTPKPVDDKDKPTDSSDGTDSRTSDTSGSKEPTVSVGVGHKSGRKAGGQHSSRP